MDTYDVVVIGGGPAGSMAAMTAAEQGLSVLLAERDPAIGCPVRCAEGVDEKGLREFFTPSPEWIAAEIASYCLVAPDGSRVMMDTGGYRGFILERLIFDRMVAEKAAEKGALIRTGVEATGLSPWEDGFRTVSLANHDREWAVRARVVVAADGVESRAARWAGLATSASVHDMETCAQVTLAGIDFEPNTFRLYFTNRFAPGGYAWLFPKGTRTANVGLGISGDFSAKRTPMAYLDDFLALHFPGASAVSRTVGGVPCSGGIERTVADGLMVCGDAAHMANPITGGGIINGLIAGRIAGETATEALKKGAAGVRALRAYEDRCEDRFGKMNRRFHKIKEGIFGIPDDRLNELAREMLGVPLDKRTPLRVLRSAVMHQPQLLLVLAQVIL
jgi:digeranylgeranylglycerophospholipid reductase